MEGHMFIVEIMEEVQQAACISGVCHQLSGTEVWINQWCPQEEERCGRKIQLSKHARWFCSCMQSATSDSL